MDEPGFWAEKTPGSRRKIIGQDYWVAPEDLLEPARLLPGPAHIDAGFVGQGHDIANPALILFHQANAIPEPRFAE
jgi:hypothetical protein